MSLLDAFQIGVPKELKETIDKEQPFETNIALVVEDLRLAFHHIRSMESIQGERDPTIYKWLETLDHMGQLPNTHYTHTDDSGSYIGGDDFDGDKNVYLRIPTETFNTETAPMEKFTERLMILVPALNGRAMTWTNDIIPWIMWNDYCKYTEAPESGFYYHKWGPGLEGRLEYWNSGRKMVDSKWTPLLQHINLNSIQKWSIGVLWDTLVARATLKTPLEPLEPYLPVIHQWIKTKHHTESTVLNDILFSHIIKDWVNEQTSAPWNGVKNDYSAILANIVKYDEDPNEGNATDVEVVRTDFKAKWDFVKDRDEIEQQWAKRIQTTKEPDLIGIATGDLDTIWQRATHGDTVETLNERTRAYVHVADAIKQWLYATPSYQVAACVAGFSGFQVSQLYFEKNYSDVEALYERSKEQTLAEGETQGEATKKLKAASGFKRKRISIFSQLMANMTPSELRSGLVDQQHIHHWLAQLYETPEWNSRVHWRPKLQVHYFDAIAMIHHRLKATASKNGNLILLEEELNERHAVNCGRRLFRAHRSVTALELGGAITRHQYSENHSEMKTFIDAQRGLYDTDPDEYADTLLDEIKAHERGMDAEKDAKLDARIRMVMGQLEHNPLMSQWRIQSLESELRDYAWENQVGGKPGLFKYRLDICHIVALKIRNDEMLKGSWHGISRSFPRSAKMINSRLTTLIQKMTSTG